MMVVVGKLQFGPNPCLDQNIEAVCNVSLVAFLSHQKRGTHHQQHSAGAHSEMFGTLPHYTPPKINSEFTPKKWWLEDFFAIGIR